MDNNGKSLWMLSTGEDYRYRNAQAGRRI